MSSVMDSGASNARIDRVCPKCNSTKKIYEGDWPSQVVKCAKCKNILGYTKLQLWNHQITKLQSLTKMSNTLYVKN